MLSVTKSWRNLPAAHRQPNHDGHCRYVHGHNWGFDVEFNCSRLDSNGFVVDVGKLKEVTRKLEELFDHTCLINGDDPLLGEFKEMDQAGVLKLVIVRNCGMEALASLVADVVQEVLWMDSDYEERSVTVVQVVCYEDSKNKATFIA